MSPSAFMPIVYLVGFLVFVFIANYCIDYCLRNSFVGARYRLFVAPGIAIHELSHALAAVITRSQVKKINILAPDGGYVIHAARPSFWRPFANTIISLAPIAGVTLSFLAITKLLAPNLLHSSGQISLNTLTSHFPLSNWQSWLHLYLTLSFATALAPSWQDMKVASRGLLYILIILVFLSITPLQPYMDNTVRSLTTPALVVLFFLVFAIILSTVLFIITRLCHSIRQSTSHKH